MTRVLPVDTPLWVKTLIEALEDKAHDMLDRAKTSDEALRAAGAFSLLKYAGAEIENEVMRQEQESRSRINDLNARF